jgi:hypothetical protein
MAIGRAWIVLAVCVTSIATSKSFTTSYKFFLLLFVFMAAGSVVPENWESCAQSLTLLMRRHIVRALPNTSLSKVAYFIQLLALGI